jgi:hypothetical protein
LFYGINAQVYGAYLAGQFSGDLRLSNPWQPAKYDQHFLIMERQPI